MLFLSRNTLLRNEIFHITYGNLGMKNSWISETRFLSLNMFLHSGLQFFEPWSNNKDNTWPSTKWESLDHVCLTCTIFFTRWVFLVWLFVSLAARHTHIDSQHAILAKRTKSCTSADWKFSRRLQWRQMAEATRTNLGSQTWAAVLVWLSNYYFLVAYWISTKKLYFETFLLQFLMV